MNFLQKHWKPKKHIAILFQPRKDPNGTHRTNARLMGLAFQQNGHVCKYYSLDSEKAVTDLYRAVDEKSLTAVYAEQGNGINLSDRRRSSKKNLFESARIPVLSQIRDSLSANWLRENLRGRSDMGFYQLAVQENRHYLRAVGLSEEEVFFHPVCSMKIHTSRISEVRRERRCRAGRRGNNLFAVITVRDPKQQEEVLVKKWGDRVPAVRDFVKIDFVESSLSFENLFQKLIHRLDLSLEEKLEMRGEVSEVVRARARVRFATILGSLPVDLFVRGFSGYLQDTKQKAIVRKRIPLEKVLKKMNQQETPVCCNSGFLEDPGERVVTALDYGVRPITNWTPQIDRYGMGKFVDTYRSWDELKERVLGRLANPIQDRGRPPEEWMSFFRPEYPARRMLAELQKRGWLPASNKESFVGEGGQKRHEVDMAGY